MAALLPGEPGGLLKRTVAVVHFHTPGLALGAVAAVARTWTSRRSGDRLIVVDNGSSAGERAQLAEAPAELLSGHGNLGYAGAINHALRATGPDQLVVLNADVVVQPECLELMFGALDRGAAVCGPSLFWDPNLTVHLPPAQSSSWMASLGDALAGRSAWLDRGLRRMFRRSAHRFWEAQEPLLTWRLSGAILGLSSRAMDRVGAFDEGFQLYFEETDWLRRARAARQSGWYLPAARAVHLYDQSPDPASTSKNDRFVSSAQRFRRRHFPAGRHLLERAARSKGSRLRSPASNQKALPCPPQTAWVEWSSRPCGFPMAARRGSDLELPEGIVHRDSQTALFQRCVARSGREFEFD
jgi:GT2 family glycosyltransferase